MSISGDCVGTVVPEPSDLGEPRSFTAAEAAAAAGVSLTRALRYWRALGYPPSAGDAVELTRSDVEMLRMMTGQGTLDDSDSLWLTRVLSRVSGHLEQLRVEVTASRMGPIAWSRADATRTLTYRVPEAQWLLGQVSRRELAAALPFDEKRPCSADSDSCVGFVDIVGFTEIGRDRSDIELARIVARFENRVTEVVVDCGGDVVTLLSDEVLFTADDAVTVAEIALRLVVEFDADPDITGLRVGLALGPITRHLGDVFGSAVDLASRLTALALPDGILISPALAAELASYSHFTLTQQESRAIRGFGALSPVLLDRAWSLDT